MPVHISGLGGNLPHPAAMYDPGPELDRIITALEQGGYPQPEVAIWRDDLPPEWRVRLAKATGATEAQIATLLADPAAQRVAPDGTVAEAAQAGGAQ
jgi:hypothetical protein